MNKSKVQNRSTKNDPILKDIPMACADEKCAVEFFEKQRWGDHSACPECGSLDVYQMMDSKTGERQKNFRWRCRDCKKQFTARTGTVFEDSRIPLRHWCFAFWRSATSKKGVSALEIHRQTGISYKSSLFMLHRIRFAMSDSTTAHYQVRLKWTKPMLEVSPVIKAKASVDVEPRNNALWQWLNVVVMLRQRQLQMLLLKP